MDFFGIEEDQRHEHEAGSSASVADEKNGDREVHKLMRSLRRKKKSKEVVVQAHFGQVRLDHDARKSYLGDLYPEKFMRAVSKSDATSRSNHVDEGQNSTVTKRAKQNSRNHQSGETAFNNNHSIDESIKDGQLESSQCATNYFDEQYFGSVLDVSQSQHDGETSARDQKQYAQFSDSDRGFRRQSEQSDNCLQRQREPTDSRSAYVSSSNRSRVTNNKFSSKVEEGSVNVMDGRHFTQVGDLSHSTSEAGRNAASSQKHHAEDSFFDEQFFPNHVQTREPSACKSEVHAVDSIHQASSETQNTSLDSDLSFIDAQYNGTTKQASARDFWDKPERSSSSVNKVDTNQSTGDDLSFIEAQYFSGGLDPVGSNPASVFDSTLNQYGVACSAQVALDLEWKRIGEDDGVKESVNVCSHSSAQQGKLEIEEVAKQHSTVGRSVPLSKIDSHMRQQREEHALTNSSKQTKKHDFHEESSVQEPKSANQDTENSSKADGSAYTVAMKMRRKLRSTSNSDQEEGKLPKDKKRVLEIKERVPDIHRMPATEVVQLLAESIIFENDDFIAIDKPYGLPSHGGPGVRVSIGQVLQMLSQHLTDRGQQQLDSLHLVHRLDKETTGAMLLAKNAEVAWQLLGMFRRREVGKTYWTVTKGLPHPREGVVDIPLARQKVGAVYKTVVKPRVYASQGKIRTQNWSHRDNRSQEAVTEYHVLAHRDSMALVRCHPLTGVQHQIRAHLAQALNTPVLGDHKYSHSDRLAPQKLFPEALQKLGIRQAQVRHIPLHLHAKGLLLPEWRGKTNIFIKASIPRFFLKTLHTLKIKIPPK